MKKIAKTKKLFKSIISTIAISVLTITVNADTTRLIPVGQTVGVTLDMKGVTVVDTTDIEDVSGNKATPAKDCGLCAGDVIIEINGNEINSAKELEDKICDNKGSELRLKINRNNNEKELKVKPVMSGIDDKYRIGVWVKDAASGIGTVTYLNPESNEFGALGHGITDLSDNKIVSIKNGNIMESKVVSVRKGGKGHPGELVAVFTENDNKLGRVSSNSEVGVKGQLDKNAEFNLIMDAVEVANREEVTEGTAEIICNIEEGKIKKYSVEIQKINKDINNPKGMVIKVKDDELLRKTGGIVQGMSGSPILQNGKIVGAVTHVFVNDPTRGYGIFIENMLEE